MKAATEATYLVTGTPGYSVQTSQPTRPPPPPQRGFRDGWAAVLFLLSGLFVFYLAFGKGLPALEAAASYTGGGSGSGTDDGGQPALDQDQGSDGSFAIAVCALSALGGAALSLGWVAYALHHAEGVIMCTLWWAVSINAAVALSCALVGLGGGALVFFIAALVNVCFLCAVRSRVPFAAANIRCAAAALLQHKRVLAVPVFVGLVQLLYAVVFLLAGVGLVAWQVERGVVRQTDTGDGQQDLQAEPVVGVEWAAMLLLLLWTAQVAANVVHVTVSGVAATWWFQGDGEPGTVSGALCRALTTSFGSVCFGSLVVAVVSLLHQMAEAAARSDRRNVAAFCAACCLDCIQRLAEYFTRWAFVYVAVYGYDFMTAGHAVTTLFKERGLTAVVNDSLVSNVLSLGALVTGALTCLAGVLAAAAAGRGDAAPLVGGAAFVLGFSVALVVLRTLESAVNTIFVCFADDPAALMQTHPREHRALLEAWRHFHPEAVRWVVVSAV